MFLGAISIIGNFFRNLLKSRRKIPRKRDRSATPQPADAPRVDEELQQFLSSRRDFLSHSDLKNSIITNLKSSETPLPQDLIERIQALKHPRALSFLGYMYRVERGKLKMVDSAKMEGNMFTDKWEDVDFNNEKIVKELEGYVTNAEKKQREYIADEVLKRHRSPDIQEKLSDIRHYEETLKDLASGFDINDSNVVYFTGSNEDLFLQSVLKKHTERQKQLASDVKEYLARCKSIVPPIQYLETALAFADPSQQMNFVDIMKNTPHSELKVKLEAQLTGAVKPFDKESQKYGLTLEKKSDFLATAEKALNKLNETPGFSAAFAQASYTDRHQLILDYQLPDSIHQSCLDFLDNKKYAEYIGREAYLKGETVDRCLKDYLTDKLLKEDQISQEFKSGLQGLSLQELKDVKRSLLSQEFKYNSGNYEDFIPDKLSKEHFPSLHTGNVHETLKTAMKKGQYIPTDLYMDTTSKVRTNQKIRFIEKQQHLITEWSQKTGASISLSQELAEKFIKDQSKPIAQMDLAMPSSHTNTHEKLQQLQQLKQSATQSTQRSHNLSELDRKRESPHSESGPSQQP